MRTDRAKGSTQQLLRAPGLSSSIHPFNAVSAPDSTPSRCQIGHRSSQIPSGTRPESFLQWGNFLLPYSSDPRVSFVLSPGLGVSSEQLSARISTSSDEPMTRYMIQKTEDSPHRARSSIRCCPWSYIYDASCSKRNDTRRGRWDIYTDCGRHVRPGCRLLSMFTNGGSLGNILRLWMSRWKSRMLDKNNFAVPLSFHMPMTNPQ